MRVASLVAALAPPSPDSTSDAPPLRVTWEDVEYDYEKEADYYASRGDPTLSAEEMAQLVKEWDAGVLVSPRWRQSSYV
jgi:predicted alpha/beta hydrolase family esterase